MYELESCIKSNYWILSSLDLKIYLDGVDSIIFPVIWVRIGLISFFFLFFVFWILIELTFHSFLLGFFSCISGSIDLIFKRISIFFFDFLNRFLCTKILPQWTLFYFLIFVAMLISLNSRHLHRWFELVFFTFAILFTHIRVSKIETIIDTTLNMYLWILSNIKN